jgi:hypothetical protein
VITRLLSAALLTSSAYLSPAPAQGTQRARDLGVPFEGTPGRLNALTDVAGVEVGHTTLISGAAPRRILCSRPGSRSTGTVR